jgi:hypothetical protein
MDDNLQWIHVLHVEDNLQRTILQVIYHLMLVTALAACFPGH